MKKHVFAILIVLVAAGVVGTAAANEECTLPPGLESYTDLLAGQTEDVGDIYVWNDAEYLYVYYMIDAPGWYLTETHLDAKCDESLIPQTSKENPIPGQYEFGDTFAMTEMRTTWCQAIPIPACNDDVCGQELAIAAHAVVVKLVEGCTETVWQIGDVEEVNATTGLLNNYADEFNWGYPAGPFTAGPNLNIDQPAFTNPFIVGTTPTDEFPYNANKIKEYATYINVQWNGELPFGGTLIFSWSPGQSATEVKQFSGDGISLQSFSAFGEAQSGNGWFLDTYPLVENTLPVQPLVSGDYDIYIRHTQGDGTFWDWLRLEKPCVQEETAWGDGERFAEKGNWGMYFTYTVRCCGDTGLVNGGFEAPVVQEGWDIFQSGTDGLGWTVEWAGDYSGAPDIANLEIHTSGTVVDAYGGNQYAELDTDWDGPGSSGGEEASVKISQDLNTCPGQDYTLAYAWSPRGNEGETDEMEVWWDGYKIDTHFGSAQEWTYSTQTVTATGLITELAFVETGTANSFGMFLDDVSVELA